MTRNAKTRATAAKPGSKPPGTAGLLWKGPLIVVALGALVVLAVDLPGWGGGRDGAASDGSAGQATSSAGPQSTSTAGGATEAWFYDEANDQHWHPGHGHWHPGPPPPPAQRQAAAAQPVLPTMPQASVPSGITPEPWFYDAAKDQHWHPEHGHWHPGPPPAVEER